MCYINSTLQTLLHIPEMRDALLAGVFDDLLDREVRTDACGKSYLNLSSPDRLVAHTQLAHVLASCAISINHEWNCPVPQVKGVRIVQLLRDLAERSLMDPSDSPFFAKAFAQNVHKFGRWAMRER